MKDANSSTDIEVLPPAVEKLTFDAENLNIVKNTDQEKPKTKSHRTGEGGLAMTKQTAKSRMLAEISKRRRARVDTEKRLTKQPKEDTSRITKTLSCTLCGVAMADGPRTICKSCITRQKRDMSREKNQSRDTKPGTRSPLSASSQEDTKDQADSVLKKKEMDTTESPTKEEKQAEETPTMNRSVSLDTVESNIDTFKKYGNQKRTNTDLGPNSIIKPTQEKNTNEMNPMHQSKSPLKPTGGVAKTNSANDLKNESELHSLDYSNKKASELPGLGTRLIKRSTTDSEIVNKSKLNSKTITNKEDQKAAFANSGRQPPYEDSRKRGSPRPEKKDAFSSKVSSQENVNVGMKLERSKTVMGKMNVDGDKKVGIEFERTRVKEGSNVSTESEKSYSKKKFTNSGRSHTIIGDGHNKRQKSKGDWAKPKAGKRENSSCSIMKKKMDEKNGLSEEDGKRVSFVEGETLKTLVTKNALIPKRFPQNLYDYKKEDGYESSDSEEDGECTPVEKPKGRNTPLNTEMLMATKGMGKDSQTKPSGVYSQVESHSSTTRSGNYGGGEYDSTRGGTEAESHNSQQISRWLEESIEPMEYDTIMPEEDDIAEYEAGSTERSYSENYKWALEKIEEHSDGEVSEVVSEGDLYTSYPSKQEDSSHHSDEVNNESQHRPYFDGRPVERHVTYPNANLEQGEDVYTIDKTTQSNIVPKSGETYCNYESKSNSPQAEYTNMRVTELWRPTMLGNGDSAPDYYNSYETDVDTGFSVLHPQNEMKKHGTEYGKEWGFGGMEDGYSSSSSDDDDQVKCSDSWYTGGYYVEPKSNTSLNKDDLVYYNDKAAKKMSESDMYTGEIFSNALAQGNDQTDMSNNNKITLEDNLIEGSNFWIISSRPQMHQMNWDPLSRTETIKNIDVLCLNWDDDQSGNDAMVEDLTLPFTNVSNNNDIDDESKPSTSSEFNEKFAVQIGCKSDYTEYTSDLLANVRPRKPQNEIVLLGNKDFTKYDMPGRGERVREESNSMRNCDSYKTDALFFGEDSSQIVLPKRAKSPTEQGGLYFNKNFKPVMRVDHSPEPARCHYPKDEDYQGGFFYASRYECNNNNNNDEDGGNYTGCFRNEEEYKPTHDGLFNDKASSFVYQKRAPEHTPLYFCNANSKSYYDTEESVYAFEKKREAKIKPREIPKILKVGSIVVRNNVECEVDYAQNIDMDSQDVPKTWMRYNYGGDNNVADISSYAQNVSFEDFGGAKPWAVEGCRAPWRVTKTLDKKGKEEIMPNKNGDGNGSWKAAPDKMVRSVKTLGSYVTKWF